MPRTARKNITTPYIHIMVQGIRKEYIFRKEIYKKEYLKLLNNAAKDEKGIIILAYCIMDNHAHILVYTENIEILSNIMQKTNSAYGVFYNQKEHSEGYVFKNRYKAQIIGTQKHLYTAFAYIHNNPVKANMVKKLNQYKYSSYNLYKSNKINKKCIKLLFGTDNYHYKFDIMHKKIADLKIMDIEEELPSKGEIKSFLDEYIKKQKISMEEIKKNNFLIMKISNKLKEKYFINDSEIAYMLGIGKNRIRRIKKSNGEKNLRP